MTRLTLIVGVVAILVGALAGVLGSGLWSGRVRRQLADSEAGVERLRREVDELRTQNERMDKELRGQQTRAQLTEEDLRREKELNARLQLLVSEGRK